MLKTKSISGMLHTKRLISYNNCHDFVIRREMLEKMKSEIYYNTAAESTTADDYEVDY